MLRVLAEVIGGREMKANQGESLRPRADIARAVLHGLYLGVSGDATRARQMREYLMASQLRSQEIMASGR